MERDRIVERTAPGRERRLAAGIPSGGRFGPTYGYRWPDKNGAKTQRPLCRGPRGERHHTRTLCAHCHGERQRTQARPRVDGARRTDAKRARGLVRQPDHPPHPQPIYCGRGTTKRWETVRTTAVNSGHAEVYDYATSRDRTRPRHLCRGPYPIARSAPGACDAGGLGPRSSGDERKEELLRQAGTVELTAPGRGDIAPWRLCALCAVWQPDGATVGERRQRPALSLRATRQQPQPPLRHAQHLGDDCG